MNYPWNHGRISRQNAENLLVAKHTDGAFLVRESESVNGAHVLSLWFGNMIHHFRVFKKENKFTIQATDKNAERVFTTLADVIELFKQPGQGLPCELKEPIIKESVSYFDHDSDDDDRVDVIDGPVLHESDIAAVTDEVTVSSIFVDKMSEMDTSGLDNEFQENLRRYLNSGFARDGTRINTSAPATDLQELIVSSSDGVSRELRTFLKKIQFLQELFSPEKDAGKLTCVTSTPNSNQSNNVCAFNDLVTDLAKCVAGVKSLEMLAQRAHLEHANFMKSKQSQTRTFEVNTCGNFKTRAFLKVDITEGKLWFMKNENESIDDSYVVDHDKILQLVKDPDTPKLTFRIDNRSSREYLFKDVQDRENLCQLAQHMMNLHSPNKKGLDKISVFVGTWNMGSVVPPGIESWLKCNGSGETIKEQEFIETVGHDIYAIGTQESSIGETAWISKLKIDLKMLFKIDYFTVAAYTLWGIRLVVLAKPEHKNRISRVERSSVKTGIANKLGNKGGVGISFDILSTSLCFINTHLASGNEDLRKHRRQQNYVDILKGLNLGHKRAYDLTNQFHHVFWFGDLNYRIDMEFEVISDAIKGLLYKDLLNNDQLRKEKSIGNVFFEFHESDLHFPPTYRYKRGTRDTYEHVKVKRGGNRVNVPSWCDRVLRKSFPELPIKQISYGCTNDIVSSDHSPVFASFEVPITSQFVASQDQATVKSQTDKTSCKIHIQYIKAKVKTHCKTNFYLEFHSVCLGASQKSKVGKPSLRNEPPRNVDSSPVGEKFTQWDNTMMPELNPIVDDPEYLREQHLLIAVKSDVGDESYGECVLSLKPHLFSSPQQFEVNLTHGGIQTGEITGSMNVQSPKLAAPSKRPAIGKLESGYRKPTAANPSHNRPYSCLGPPVQKSLPDAKKSASLGRQLTKFSDLTQGLRHTPPGELHENTYSIPEVPKRTKVNTSTDQTSEPLLPPRLPVKPSTDKTSNSESLVPPPLPVKSSKITAFPASVDEFLSKLGLRQYLSNLEDIGFDEVLFLEDLSDEDLAHSGITNGEHVRQILNEIKFLKQAGFFQS